jgi:hypothetical protein
MAGHARVLDRRRFQLLTGDGDAGSVLTALDAYRNPDGGYGWGLEADLRTPESQPGTALHAFEALTEIAEAGGAPELASRAAGLCDWLGSVTLPDGGLPMALQPLGVPEGSAPWWAGADMSSSSLQITAVSAASAHRLAAHVPEVAAHPWLDRATRYCLDAIDALDEAPHAYVLSFALQLLDAVHDTHPEAAGLLSKLARYLPASGTLPVEGGTENEMLRPLDIAPFPGRPVRGLLDAKVIEADLDRLAAEQRDDGGWTVDYAKISPAGALDWRGYITVHAVTVLLRNGR